MTTRDILLALTSCVAVACGGTQSAGDDDSGGQLQTLDPAVCAPANGPFSLDIDNQFFPLPVGHQLVLEGDDGGTLVRVEITVLDETEQVAGVTTRVVQESESEDGETVEMSRNYFVQAADGTVCYYGEEVDTYSGGAVTGHGGSWRAGDGSNQPGIIMPGTPAVNTQFAQEGAPGVAEDMSAITELGASVTVPAGTYDGALHAVDWSPLEGGSVATGEDKYYAPGIGLIVDDVVKLKSSQ